LASLAAEVPHRCIVICPAESSICKEAEVVHPQVQFCGQPPAATIQNLHSVFLGGSLLVNAHTCAVDHLHFSPRAAWAA